MTRPRSRQAKAERALDFLVEDIITAHDNGASEQDIRQRIEAAFIVVGFSKPDPSTRPGSQGPA